MEVCVALETVEIMLPEENVPPEVTSDGKNKGRTVFLKGMIDDIEICRRNTMLT